jgi:hypothetical protein
MSVVSRAKQLGRDLTARAIAPVLRRLAHDPIYFELWESYGFHVTGSDFYQPIPNTGDLPLSLWNRVSDLPGIDMREEQQKQLLSDIVAGFKNEFTAIPKRASTQEFRYYLGNTAFEAVDAEMLFGLIRLFKPRRMYEVGSGFSTLLAADALRRNARMDIHAASLLSTRTRLRSCKPGFHPKLNCGAYLFRTFRSMSFSRFATTTFCSLTPRMYVKSVVTCNSCF